MSTPPETMPVRVQLKRAKGWKMPENTIKVDRSTKWGNPFKLNSQSSRLTCLSKFKTLVKASHDVLYFCSSDLQEYRRNVDTNVTTLRGKNLACWCPLPACGGDDICHAAVLLKIANDIETIQDYAI